MFGIVVFVVFVGCIVIMCVDFGGCWYVMLLFIVVGGFYEMFVWVG